MKSKLIGKIRLTKSRLAGFVFSAKLEFHPDTKPLTAWHGFSNNHIVPSIGYISLVDVTERAEL
jgi:hypothetical protein